MFNYFTQVIKKSYVMAEMEARKLWHDPTEMISRAVQPILWLGIFGEALSKVTSDTHGKFFLSAIYYTWHSDSIGCFCGYFLRLIHYYGSRHWHITEIISDTDSRDCVGLG